MYVIEQIVDTGSIDSFVNLSRDQICFINYTVMFN